MNEQTENGEKILKSENQKLSLLGITIAMFIFGTTILLEAVDEYHEIAQVSEHVKWLYIISKFILGCFILWFSITLLKRL